MTQRLKLSQLREVTSGTREWADYNVNCIKGCYNNCRYCYARIMAERFGRIAKGRWAKMAIRKDVLKKRFKTSVSIEPFLDYDPTDLFDQVSPFITESIWIGRMNYIPRKNLSRAEEPFFSRIRQNYKDCSFVTAI